MLVPHRFQRALPMFIVAVLCVVLFAAVRARHSDFVESALYRVKHGHAPPADPGSTPKPAPPPLVRLEVGPGQCRQEIEALRHLRFGLTNTIRYSRKCIKPVYSSGLDRDRLAKQDGSFIPTRTVPVNLTSCVHDELPACETVTLEVPKPYPSTRYPNFVFGIATSYERVNDSLPAFAHWLSGTGAKLVAVVVDAENQGKTSEDLKALETLYRHQDVELKAVEPRNKTLRVEQHHFAMVEDMLDLVDDKTEWLGVLDDDTFFPSLYALDDELKKYDHTQDMWLGQLSEDFESVHSFGFMAFGGAGVFLSVPLAQKLMPYMPRCLVEARVPTGDCILRDCIWDHTNTKLTLVHGLYQHDLRGDASGFYEAGLRPLSLHHWKSWYKAPIVEMAQAVKLCGDCFLQRFQFGKDTLFANGYSITQYNKSLDSYDLTRMEGTWEGAGPKYDYYVGMLRPKVDKADKKSYVLIDSQQPAKGGLRQIYVHRGNQEDGEEDEVIEVVWDALKAS